MKLRLAGPTITVRPSVVAGGPSPARIPTIGSGVRLARALEG